MGLRRLITEFLWPPSSSIIRPWLPYSVKVLVKTNQTSPNSVGLRRLIRSSYGYLPAPSSDQLYWIGRDCTRLERASQEQSRDSYKTCDCRERKRMKASQQSDVGASTPAACGDRSYGISLHRKSPDTNTGRHESGPVEGGAVALDLTDRAVPTLSQSTVSLTSVRLSTATVLTSICTSLRETGGRFSLGSRKVLCWISSSEVLLDLLNWRWLRVMRRRGVGGIVTSATSQMSRLGGSDRLYVIFGLFRLWSLLTVMQWKSEMTSDCLHLARKVLRSKRISDAPAVRVLAVVRHFRSTRRRTPRCNDRSARGPGRVANERNRSGRTAVFTIATPKGRNESAERRVRYAWRDPAERESQH
ncbi:hypothetical protein EVAR_26452_1 [Eumeta japonica]|uniref:Uncharacterized protein n=1 Tax=Eumeta variegata TaxID=151549 RepID=A0A4C1VR02_EUMVA|nr:hypothetical protein EVAR_26452_1 [Eumeta japonica]